MPELPEVETTKMGIAPYLENHHVAKVIIRQKQLRWLIPDTLYLLEGQRIHQVERRAKYLLLHTDLGYAIVHLGMSGCLRVLDADIPAQKHDHLDLVMQSGVVLRYTDPRRFGAWLWAAPNEQHSVLSKLGPEPLTETFDLAYFYAALQKKFAPIKQVIMNNAVTVGVGNIYATESLFIAGIHPLRPAKSLSKKEARRLLETIKSVLIAAIKQGGTTLKNFAQADGKPGYFAQALNVYGRQGLPCPQCGAELEKITIGQRNTVFCSTCQS